MPDARTAQSLSALPPAVTTFTAAFLEPVLLVGVYLAALAWADEPLKRADLVLALFVIALSFPGRDRFLDRPLNALVDIASSWLVLLLVLACCAWVTDSLHLYDRAVLLGWVVAAPMLLAVVTLVGIALVRRHAATQVRRRRAVIVGAGPHGAKMAQALRAARVAGVSLEGFFDDRKGTRLHPEAADKRLGSLIDVASHVRETGVSDVYITLPLSSQPRIAAVLEGLKGTTASVYFAPDIFATSVIQGRLREINGLPVVGLCETPFVGINRVLKRGSDVLLSLCILVPLLPVLAVLAVGVKLSSPGPVLFRQRRNGLDGEEIEVYKFRSMRCQDNGADVRQATRGDARVTPFGAFIRRTSLDELPQFFNVLQGSMSIVGPRPHAVAHNQQYAQLVSAYMVRHKAKPGITGWAQVNGYRGETDTLEKMQSRVEHDLAYLRNWSLSLDLQIIARTVKLVFFDRNAY